MRILASLILAGSLLYSSQTYPMESEDKIKGLQKIVSYFSKLNDGVEHLVYYSLDDNRIVDVSLDRTKTSVFPDWKAIRKMSSKKVIFAHNHKMSVEQYLEMRINTQEEKERFLNSDKTIAENRMMIMIPSPHHSFFSGDISTMMLQEESLRKENPQIDISHAIVYFSTGSKPRVIEYGISNLMKESYFSIYENENILCDEWAELGGKKDKEFDKKLKECQNEIRRREIVRDRIISSYSEVLFKYVESTIDPLSDGKGKEPNLDEFIEKVNENSHIFLKDWGHFDE